MKETEPFVLKTVKGVSYLEVRPLFNTGKVYLGFSTRLGGKSKGPFSGLNLGFNVGDTEKIVSDNWRQFLSIWDINEDEVFVGKQVHGNQIRLVTQNDKNDRLTFYPGIDALVSSEAGIFLGAVAADCIIIFFLDPEKNIVGIAHAGWRGTFKGIASKMVRYLVETFSTNPSDLIVALSPSVGKCCYEVKKPMVNDFRNNLPKGFSFFIPGKDNCHYFIDLKKINVFQLKTEGVLHKNIYKSQYCTACRPDLFYSYRRDGKKTGRLAGIIGLKS